MTSTRRFQPSTAKADRKARLAEELRANLQKRKAQTRSRRTGEADDAAGRAATQPTEELRPEVDKPTWPASLAVLAAKSCSLNRAAPIV